MSPTRTDSGPAERDRKAEHIKLALDGRMQVAGNAWERYRFRHVALPEIDLAEIDTAVEFLGKRLQAPLLISCMTGGTGDATRINRNLAIAAERTGIAVGVGSQRKALEDAATAESFAIRPYAPTAPIVGNLGAVQFNYGFGIAECRRAVEMIDADALALHLNPLQEAIQPEGQTDFRDLLPRMAEVAGKLGRPVIVKEIGSGISAAVAGRLADNGMRLIDVAGVGGTSWARIEAARAADTPIGELFADWGISTPEALEELQGVPGLYVIGSGGLRHGIDVAKAIALGARVAGMAYQFLLAADESADRVVEKIERTVRELKICMFCVGARNLAELRRVPLDRRPTGAY